MDKSFDFQASRHRIEELKMMYRKMKHSNQCNGSWDWWIKKQIKELEQEIDEAHKKRMTVGQDGHYLQQLNIKVTSMVLQVHGVTQGCL